jgi:transposase
VDAAKLVEKLLDSRGWKVVDVETNERKKRMTVQLEPKWDAAYCSGCGALSREVGGVVKERTWRGMPMGTWDCWLRSPLRRVRCKSCGKEGLEAIPWARPGSRYTLDFEREVLAMARSSSFLAVATHFKIGWKVVNNLVSTLVQWHSARVRRRKLSRIGVDEISYGRGHSKYLTVVWDHDRSEVVWMGEGKEGDVLRRFYAELGKARCARLKVVTMDMYEGYIQATKECAPHAAIVFDRFHVERHLSEAVDEVRRQEFFRRGSEMRGLIRGKRYLLLKRRARLSQKQRRALDEMLQVNKRLSSAYILKEAFRFFWQYADVLTALAFLAVWVNMFRRRRLEPLHKFAIMVARHIEGVVGYAIHGMTNAALEGNNSRIRGLSHRARGFRRVGNLMERVFHCFTPADMPWLPAATTR